MNHLSVVVPFEVKKNKSLAEFVNDLSATGFQGKALSRACFLFKEMIEDCDAAILFGYAGSLSVAGQWKIVQWLIEQNMIDVLVPTGANISEDIVQAMGYDYYQGSVNANNEAFFQSGYNRYYDIYGKEGEYFLMTEMIADFILTLESGRCYSSREFLFKFGQWLGDKQINSIVTTAAQKNIPVFCPAIADSPFGDAALLAKTKGFNLCIDSVRDYTEFMSLSNKVKSTGAVYLGGGVPKDFIQLFAVSASLLYPNFSIPGRNGGNERKITREVSYPHQYAIQITTDSPQWGGLSGCTFDEAVTWGKELTNNKHVQCYCDATIALPLIVQAVADHLGDTKRGEKRLNACFGD